MGTTASSPPRAATTAEPRRRRLDHRAYHAALAVCALLALPRECAADKAAYSLDLIGIKSGTAYTVVVNVGSTTPAPSFRLIADTGSSNDAVLGAGCCGSGATVTYSCAASSTCVETTKDVTLAFAGATIAGDFVKDTWSSSEFGSITKDFLVIEQQDTFYRTEYDGITGLAYKALGKPKDAPNPTFYDTLVSTKSGTPDAFGMLLCGIVQPLLTQSNYSLHAGQLIVGGTEGTKGEKFYTGPILYTPIAQEAWYVTIITDIGFDGKSLGLPCSSYNTPQAIIDSGTSNMAFPSDVYNALMAQIKAATKKAEPGFADTYFDFSKSCCGKDYCDPSDATIALLSLPSIYITLALDDGASGTKSHYTVEIPPEYYFRPEMNGADSDVPCRAIGIAEGSSIVLGDVFMDGLFAYHDRTNKKLGLAVADNCPNGVKSKKKISQTTAKTDDWCDCFSSTLKTKSLLSRYVPWGSGCFFMPWWLWVVLASALVVIVCLGVLGYWYYTGRRDKKRMMEIQASAVAPTDMDTLTQRTAAASKDRAPSQQRQPPSQQQLPDANYSMMSSPRELVDSQASSVALLMTPDDARRPHGQQNQHQQHQQQRTYYVDDGKPPPPRKDSNRSSSSTQRETSGFLL